MQSKLAISALVVASLLGATAIASAQTQQPAPGASSEGNVGPGATGSKMKSDKMKSSKVKSGTTTGMNSGAQKGNKTDKYNNSNSAIRADAPFDKARMAWTKRVLLKATPSDLIRG